MRHGQRPAREVTRDPRLPAGFAVSPDLAGITVQISCPACPPDSQCPARRWTQTGTHEYGGDDRCVCGGEVVYFDLADPEQSGNGCEVQGRIWDPAVRRMDPQERRADARRDQS